MSLHVFVFLPEGHHEVSTIGNQESDFQKLIVDTYSLLKDLHKQQNVIIFYDDDNIKLFLALCKDLIGEIYLLEPENLLRLTLRKTARNVKDYQQKQPDCIYLHWQIDDLSVQPANTTLAEMAERHYTYPKERYLLLNVANAIPTERTSPFLAVFKDARHLRSLPDKFVHIPFVTNKDGLAAWLATNHQTSFSLEDTSRFRKTSDIVQGQPVFKELETGYFWYLDNFHKNEYEVFNGQREHIGVANLQGKLDESQKVAGRVF